jgi:hypothetical protein
MTSRTTNLPRALGRPSFARAVRETCHAVRFSALVLKLRATNH